MPSCQLPAASRKRLDCCGNDGDITAAGPLPDAGPAVRQCPEQEVCTVGHHRIEGHTRNFAILLQLNRRPIGDSQPQRQDQVAMLWRMQRHMSRNQRPGLGWGETKAG